jgi:hypothetical protein
LAVIHPQLACAHRLAARYRGDVELLDAMQGGERKGKALSFLGADQLIDVNGVNRLVALLIATTVAEGFPASGQAREKEVCHGFHSSHPRRCPRCAAKRRAGGREAPTTPPGLPTQASMSR